VRSGELPAFQIGGRGQWRVDAAKFEKFIDDRHAAARDMLATGSHPGREHSESAG
jgi:hypothetical protein